MGKNSKKTFILSRSEVRYCASCDRSFIATTKREVERKLNLHSKTVHANEEMVLVERTEDQLDLTQNFHSQIHQEEKEFIRKLKKQGRPIFILTNE
jgi:tRNA pseudouridine-54 N-methylase